MTARGAGQGCGEAEIERAIEAVRVAIRDGWGDGCSRVCPRENDAGISNRCSCWEMAKLCAPVAIRAAAPSSMADGEGRTG